MIFPKLKNKKFGYLNINNEAEIWCSEVGIKVTTEDNPLNDPATCQRMLAEVHAKHGIDFSYGGYMEDRSFLWKGSYLERDKNFIHLGLDLNVPTGTEVAVDFDGTVIAIEDDFPTIGGWGPSVTIKHAQKPVYLVYVHLDRDISCKAGDVLKKGDIFAKVGKPPYNGNWFPHCHVQVIKESYFDELEKTNGWSKLDGYGRADEAALYTERFDDPMHFIDIQ